LPISPATEPSTQDESPSKALVYRRVPLAELPAGIQLSSGVKDTDGRKLLGAAVPLTEDLQRRLKAKGIHSVLVSATDYRQISTDNAATLPIGLRCRNCDLRLPIRPVEDEEWSITWICKKCLTPYRGHFSPGLAKTHGGNISIGKFRIDRTRLQNPPRAIAATINSWKPQPYEGKEQREKARRRLTMPVAVMPVDDGFKPVGVPVLLTTRDISLSGICLLHDQPLWPKYLVVDLPARNLQNSIQLVVEVVRCRAVGDLFEIAGRFVMRSED
jgi:hypothetical protein